MITALDHLREIADFQAVIVIELAMVLAYLSYIAHKLLKIK